MVLSKGSPISHHRYNSEPAIHTHTYPIKKAMIIHPLGNWTATLFNGKSGISLNWSSFLSLCFAFLPFLLNSSSQHGAKLSTLVNFLQLLHVLFRHAEHCQTKPLFPVINLFLAFVVIIHRDAIQFRCGNTTLTKELKHLQL